MAQSGGKLGYNNSYFRVCVDKKPLGGRIVGQRTSVPIDFNDVGDLLLKIETVLDTQDFPRAFQRKRTFGEPQQTVRRDEEQQVIFMSIDEVTAAKGEISTFELRVNARQNASWQGRLDFLDGEQKQFMSALELIHILDEKFGA